MRVCREVSRVTPKGKRVLCGRSIPVAPRGDVERRFVPKKTGTPAMCPGHRARALRTAVQEMYAARLTPCPRPVDTSEPSGGAENERQTRADEEAEAWTDHDVETFASAPLDE